MLAVQAFRALDKALTRVINRYGLPGNSASEQHVEAYCKKNSLPVLSRIPFSRKAAGQLARGELPDDEHFADLARAIHAYFHNVCKEVRHV